MKEEIISLVEAAILLKMSPETLRRKAQTGEVPAYKSGKNWIFVDEDLLLYIRSKYHGDNNIYLTGSNLNGGSTLISKKTKAPYLVAGSSMSQHKTEKEYEKLMR